MTILSAAAIYAEVALQRPGAGLTAPSPSKWR